MSSHGAPRRCAPLGEVEIPRLADNRVHQRHLTIMRVAKFIYEAREGLGLVRNISSGGMRIDAYQAIPVGARLTVALSDGRDLAATVAWRQEQTIGVSFDRPASIKELLAIPVKDEHGRPARPLRIAVGRAALLRAGAAAPIGVQIADLSQRGAKILTDAPLVANRDIELEPIGLAAMPATIRWVQSGAAGLAFHRPLPVKNLMEWLASPP